MATQIQRYQAQTTFRDPSYPPLLQRVFSHRGITDAQALNTSLSALLPISSLAHTDAAAQLLAESIQAQELILIVADFDADGATACALSTRLLTEMGAMVDFAVPDRARHGYGLSLGLTEELLAQKPKLIMTVDNGIASHAGIALAKQHGVKVLVTDHHLPANSLPAADVIVNPNITDSTFPSKNLAGVGVAFYVLCALDAHLQQNNWYTKRNINPPKPAQYLDLVALGTVADVVPLDQNNRILVAQGLKRIRAGKASLGILALFQVANREALYAQASDLAFSIGPRINAAGRMEDMRIGIECLLSNDWDTAQKLAAKLHEINRSRREVEQTMRDQAEKIIASLPIEHLPFGLAVYQPDWHEGVVGIVASRLKEQHHRPAIVFAQSGEEVLKGSARSVAGVNIRDVLDTIDKQHPGLIIRFGGHAMAAGLSLQATGFSQFQKAFDAAIKRLLNAEDLHAQVLSDGGLNSEEFRVELAEAIEQAGPWGQKFPEPVFDNLFMVVDYRVVGEKHLKMTLQPENSETLLDAIAFFTPPDVLPPSREPVKMAYQLALNRWQGRISVQLKIIEIQP